MGKQLRQQRRGKGNPRYGFLRHKAAGRVRYFEGPGTVVDIIHDRVRRTPLAVIEAAGSKSLMIASSGMQVGQNVECKSLGEIAEGSKVYNIELHYGDGGRMCRSSGAAAILIGHDKDSSILLMPSKVKKVMPSKCRAMIGTVAGFGRHDKPFRKAGNKFFARRSTGKIYPRTSGVAMNAVDHPFGGKTHPGKQKSVSRHMPPGKKVGSISPKRTGKRK